jgi:hypothetical protein
LTSEQRVIETLIVFIDETNDDYYDNYMFDDNTTIELSDTDLEEVLLDIPITQSYIKIYTV